MFESGQQAPFLGQAFLEPRIDVTGPNQFERHDLGESLAGSLGEEDGSHSPFPDSADQPVRPNPLQSRGRPLVGIIEPADGSHAFVRRY
jgi:hypothetical protein